MQATPTVITAFSRLIAALGGGYMVCSAQALLLSLLLPLAKAEALLAAIMTSFIIYPCIIMRVYAVADLVRVWRELILMTITCLLAAALLQLSPLPWLKG